MFLFRRSLFLQVSFVLIATALTVVLILQFLVQSATVFRAFPGLMESSTRSVSTLVQLLEGQNEENHALVLTNYSTRFRSAFIQGGAFACEAQLKAPVDMCINVVDGHTFREEAGDLNRPRLLGFATLQISTPLKSGKTLITLHAPMALLSSQGFWFVGLLITLFVSLSIVILRMIFAPLSQLEAAAHQLGSTSGFDGFDEQGTEDIRRLARALNGSHLRIKTLLAERSQMLAALAHDIRTSLTHVKLRLNRDFQDGGSAYQADIDTIETLTSDMLLYARSEQFEPDFDLVDIQDFMTRFVESLPYPLNYESHGPEFWMPAEPLSLRRALSNLIDNGLKYGGQVSVKTIADVSGFKITIDDDGPGMSNHDLEHIFEPFYRVDKSRSRETGGSGLGLTISRALLSAQGATLTLSNRDEGGLRAEIVFPRAPD